MNLSITKQSYLNYIKELKIKKLNDILVCVPTFNSFELTSTTIESFLQQEGVGFDILVIGPEGDIEKLVKKYSQLNFCITKDNYGSSGNQLLNIFISSDSSYKYTLLNDNDCVFLSKNGLNYLLKKLESGNFYVAKHKSYGIFHCSLFSNELFSKLDWYFNPNYFLCFDDTAFFLNIKNKYPNKIIDYDEIGVFHPKKLETFLFNKNYIFFFTRGFLIFMFRERVPILLKLKDNYQFLLLILFYIYKYKLDYVYVFFESFKQVLNNKYSIKCISKFSINPINRYEEIVNLKTENIGEYVYIKNVFDLFSEPEKMFYLENNFMTKFFKKVGK